MDRYRQAMMVTAKAARMDPAKNHTPYMVENHWYSRLMNISKAPKVRAKAAAGLPAAESFIPKCVHFGSPSRSWEKETLRIQ